MNYEKLLNVYKVNIYSVVEQGSVPVMKLPNPILGYRTYFDSRVISGNFLNGKGKTYIEELKSK